jgi:hypothetical protein
LPLGAPEDGILKKCFFLLSFLFPFTQHYVTLLLSPCIEEEIVYGGPNGMNLTKRK